MSQSAIFDNVIFGDTALRSADPFAPVREPQVDPAIFERLPITAAEPFARPRLRLVLEGERPGTRAAARRVPSAPLRLTRRGRVVGVVVLAVITTVLSFALGLVPSQASTASGTPGGRAASGAVATSVVVQPGETLWSIASRVAPNADPRATVDALIAANHLTSAGIQAGQVLVLP